MPTYRLTAPDGTVELLEADSARVEGVHTVLRGTALVIGRPRQVVVRRAPLNVRVEELPLVERLPAQSPAPPEQDSSAAAASR